MRAFTLEEVVVSIGISAIGITGITSGYLLAAKRADWSATSAAAQWVALQRIEQVRAARWDTMADPPVDEVQSVNFPTAVQTLDLPTAGTNASYATIYTTISSVSSDPPLRFVQVDCVWSNQSRGPFTNTAVTLRGPSQ